MRAEEAVGAAEEPLERVPFVVFLYPRSGKPGGTDGNRRAALEAQLAERLPLLAKETPYGSVRVEVLGDLEQARAVLRAESCNLIECDPVLYFAAVSSRTTSQARYQIVLQAISRDLPRGQVMVLRELGLGGPLELKGRRVGFVHRVAGGAAQVQHALKDLGLSAGRDYRVRNAHYVENAFLCLKADLIDAVVVPSDAAADYLREHSYPAVEVLLSAEGCLPPLFAMRREDRERYPAFSRGVVETLRSFFGAENLVPAEDDVYSTFREEALPWEGY